MCISISQSHPIPWRQLLFPWIIGGPAAGVGSLPSPPGRNQNQNICGYRCTYKVDLGGVIIGGGGGGFGHGCFGLRGGGGYNAKSAKKCDRVGSKCSEGSSSQFRRNEQKRAMERRVSDRRQYDAIHRHSFVRPSAFSTMDRGIHSSGWLPVSCRNPYTCPGRNPPTLSIAYMERIRRRQMR